MTARFALRLLLLWTLSLPSLSAPTVDEARPAVCNVTAYGTPNLDSCFTLLYGGPDEAFQGINNLDLKDHAFLPFLGAQQKDFTAEQWESKFYLPVVWENCELSPNSNLSLRVTAINVEMQSSHIQFKSAAK